MNGGDCDPRPVSIRCVDPQGSRGGKHVDVEMVSALADYAVTNSAALPLPLCLLLGRVLDPAIAKMFVARYLLRHGRSSSFFLLLYITICYTALYLPLGVSRGRVCVSIDTRKSFNHMHNGRYS